MKFARRRDIIIIAAVLAAGLLCWVVYEYFIAQPGVYAEIYYMSEPVIKIKLTDGKDKTFSIPQKPNVVFHLYADGSISFEESDCPDRVCINSGRLSRVGESAACLPNGIIVKITAPDGHGDADLVIS